ncbi:hypothetical protein RRF57_002558 [Xylaria bambusicola]|uniref:Uncharacterized protein n=1 Tax=Xylaria bambusicola TaxID=326684 RepID=A0AAN7Z4L5_9PEZI
MPKNITVSPEKIPYPIFPAHVRGSLEGFRRRDLEPEEEDGCSKAITLGNISYHCGKDGHTPKPGGSRENICQGTLFRMDDFPNFW